MHGLICWLELATPDAAGAKAFYGELFGWRDGPGEAGFPYHFLRAEGSDKNFGGIMPQQPGTATPPNWLPYFAVADLDRSVKQVEELGGQVRVPLVKLPTGKFAVVSDPSGATFALYQGE